MRIPGMRRTSPPLDAQAAANPQIEHGPPVDRGPPDQSRTEMEARINKAVSAAEAADTARRMTGWRQWAVEQVLASPASATILATRPLCPLADDIVQYVLTGKHPTPATPEDPTHDDEAPPSPDTDAGRTEQQPTGR